MEQFKTWEEMSALEQAQCIHWDMYKDAYGVRPRGIDTSGWHLEDFEAEFKMLSDVIDANERQRHLEEERAMHDFELCAKPHALGCSYSRAGPALDP